jgi:hypothetical protein
MAAPALPRVRVVRAPPSPRALALNQELLMEDMDSLLASPPAAPGPQQTRVDDVPKPGTDTPQRRASASPRFPSQRAKPRQDDDATRSPGEKGGLAPPRYLHAYRSSTGAASSAQLMEEEEEDPEWEELVRSMRVLVSLISNMLGGFCSDYVFAFMCGLLGVKPH